MAHRRAGGFVDRGDGKGWVLDDTPAPAPPKARPRQAPTSPISQAGGWALPSDPPEPEPASDADPPKKTAAKRARSKES